MRILCVSALLVVGFSAPNRPESDEQSELAQLILALNAKGATPTGRRAMLAGLGAAVLPLAPMVAQAADVSPGGVIPNTAYDPISQAYAKETGQELDKDMEEQSGFDYTAKEDTPPGTSFNKKFWWEKEFIVEEWMLGKYDVVVDGKPTGTVQVNRRNKPCDERRFYCDPGRGLVFTGTNVKTGKPYTMNTLMESWDGSVTFDMQKINGEDKDYTTKWDGRGWTMEDGTKFRYKAKLDEDWYSRGNNVRFSW